MLRHVWLHDRFGGEQKWAMSKVTGVNHQLLDTTSTYYIILFFYLAIVFSSATSVLNFVPPAIVCRWSGCSTSNPKFIGLVSTCFCSNSIFPKDMVRRYENPTHQICRSFLLVSTFPKFSWIPHRSLLFTKH